MKGDASGQKPVLIIDDYDSLIEMAADCCSSCPSFPFWPEGDAPPFIKVTFSGVVKCDPIGNCFISGVSPPDSFNQEFTLPFIDWVEAGSGCNWCFSDKEEDSSGIVVYVGIDATVFNLVGRWCEGAAGPPPAGCGAFGAQSRFFTHAKLLVDLGSPPYANQIIICGASSRGEDGEAVIDWDP